MIPSLPAPYGVTVDVYLPLLTLTLGYVQVQGMWQELGRPLVKPWRVGRVPRMAWQKLVPPLRRDWKTEKP